MPITYTDQGVTTQTLQEILSEREVALAVAEILGVDFKITSDSAAGNLQLSDADREFDIQELIVYLVAQLNPETAEGVFLDWVCTLNNITRLQPVKTLIYPTVTGTASATISANTVTIKDTITNDLYINVSEFTFSTGGTATVEFECLAYGDIDPSNSTTFTIVTPVANVTSITWSGLSDEVIGRYRETDDQLRVRRLLEINNTQKSTESAIFARLSELVGAENVRVYSNRTMVTDGDGRPAKSFECVVEGGTDDDVADLIWDTAPAGIQMYGTNTNVTITDSQGFDQVVTFTRPADVDIYMQVDVYNDTGSLSAGYISDLKDEILAFAETKTLIGEFVDAHDYYFIFDKREIRYAKNLEVSDDGLTWAQIVDVGIREIAAFDTANIDINVNLTT